MRRVSISTMIVLLLINCSYGQVSNTGISRDELINAARDIMSKAGNCALITVDETGQPRARVMDPFPPDDQMVVWFGTNPKSRKVKQLQNDPRVTLYYFDKENSDYVVIMGKASLVTDPDLKKEKWKESWKDFYPDREKDYLLIKVVPETMEVLSTSHSILGDQETWQPPVINFK